MWTIELGTMGKIELQSLNRRIDHFLADRLSFWACWMYLNEINGISNSRTLPVSQRSRQWRNLVGETTSIKLWIRSDSDEYVTYGRFGFRFPHSIILSSFSLSLPLFFILYIFTVFYHYFTLSHYLLFLFY